MEFNTKNLTKKEAKVLQTLLDKANAPQPERECNVCHKKFVPNSPTQKTCPNVHCKKVANARQVRDRLYKIRMAELGIAVDEVVK